MSWDLKENLEGIRGLFPVLKRSVYLISNSLGAVPLQVKEDLERYFRLWAEEGVTAWSREWWDLPRKVGNSVGKLIGAGDNEITMIPNATQAHWVALSSFFQQKEKNRNKIIMTDHDFPSIIYAISSLALAMDWKVEIVKSDGKPGINTDKIIAAIDEKTLCVATSHVFFKSAFIQDINEISYFSRKRGAYSIIDGYHAVGTIPVNVKEFGVDFYIGGCLKWLCGGPGNVFLYVRPDLSPKLAPSLTGWMAHQNPFSFSPRMEYTFNSYKFMSGTFPVPSLYTAGAGLDIIKKIGVSEIREKSISQTTMIINEARKREFEVHSPGDRSSRGGAVSLSLPYAFQVKQALEARKIKVDFRKGNNGEKDIIRIGPHFYTKDDEIQLGFEAIDEILHSKEYLRFPSDITHVT